MRKVGVYRTGGDAQSPTGHRDIRGISLSFGENRLSHLPKRRWRRSAVNIWRWSFRTPNWALNPVIRIGRQQTEPMVLHRTYAVEGEAEEKAYEALTRSVWMRRRWGVSVDVFGRMCQRVLFAAVSLLQAER